MKEEHKNTFRKFRHWLAIQKITISRGYLDLQQLMIGVIFASSVKVWFPSVFKTWWSFGLLVLVSMIGLYTVGWLDRRVKLFHEENKVGTEMNPFMVEMRDRIEKK